MVRPIANRLAPPSDKTSSPIGQVDWLPKESKRVRGLDEKVNNAAIRKELIEAGDNPARRTFRVELFYLQDGRPRLIAIA